MKKLLITITVTSLAQLAFADSFQDFNNNVYLGYNNTSVNEGQTGTSNSWTLGSTLQTKNNIWINLEGNDSFYYSKYKNYTQALLTAKAGYAFQFFNNETNGFQVIPYATYTYGSTMGNLNQYYGLGVKPEYRFLGSLKASLDLTAYDLTQDGSNFTGTAQLPNAYAMARTNTAFADQTVTGYVQDFRYTINPEIQYDIAKTLLVAGGYAYDQSFNNQMVNDGNSTVYVRVGYLF